MSEKEAADHLKSLIKEVGDSLDADLLLYSGKIARPNDEALITACGDRPRRTNVLLVLTTFGGSADSAYRIARCLQRRYQKFIVFIDDYCKSAGTLLVLGADELVMSDFGELGPLDVQLSKPDEIFEVSSGLAPMQALNTLAQQSFELFESYFLELRTRSLLQITTKSASEIASSITTGLFAPIYGQVDPMRLGEIDRAVKIAIEYGKRIGKTNLKPEALERLVAGYPSHEFVIDREEADELFVNVRKPSESEQELVTLLRPIIRAQVSGEGTFVYLADPPAESEGDTDIGSDGQGDRDTAEEQPGGLEALREDGSQPAAALASQQPHSG